MKIQFIRHATFDLYIRDMKILVDPMLSPAGSMAAASNTANQKSNPLVELPVSMEDILKNTDAIVITHTHRDHLDDKAIEVLPKEIPLFCQPVDREVLINKGFQNVRPIEQEYRWRGIRFVRTSGKHGVGEMGEKMGPVSGFFIEAEHEPTAYIIGDSVWCEEVEHVLKRFAPQVIISFAGGAQFLTGGLITMGENDIKTISEASPQSQIVAAHMEAWNHCLLTRTELRTFVKKNGLSHRVIIPEDGEWMEFKALNK